MEEVQDAVVVEAVAVVVASVYDKCTATVHAFGMSIFQFSLSVGISKGTRQGLDLFTQGLPHGQTQVKENEAKQVSNDSEIIVHSGIVLTPPCCSLMSLLFPGLTHIIRVKVTTRSGTASKEKKSHQSKKVTSLCSLIAPIAYS